MSKYVGRIITDQAPAGYSVSTTNSGAGFLSVASNAAFAMGTGNFTIECWARATTTSGYGYLFQIGDFSTGIWIFRNTGSTKVIVGALNADRFTQTSTPAVDTWNHYALVRSGNTLTLYFNGIADGSVTVTGENYTSNTLRIASAAAGYPGYEYTGYISNFRIVKGTALYTAAFTPPTQLLNVTNTSILTCNSPAIVDQSSNAFAITTNGNAAVSTLTPFAAYNPAPTNANPLVPAPGVWSLDEALQYTQQGVWPSYPANAIEDVFSTYLYTGNGTTQTITNGINLATYGGLVWNKVRNSGTTYHYWVDTARGRSSGIGSNSTDAQYISSAGNDLASFTTTGYTLGPVQNWNASNSNGGTIVSWAFRKQAKFFDIVTWTGDGTNPRTINHNLGSTPGCIIIKCTSSGVADWPVWHRSLPTQGGFLNTVDPFSSGLQYFGSTVTSTTFSLNSANVRTNQAGQTYVAYLFAHDAGGFGPAGTDNVISCGSFAATSGTFVNLGWEPQWLLIKNAVSVNSWGVADNMRGVVTGGNDQYLLANATDAEASAELYEFNATGFTIRFTASNDNYIYIAIRRGPMRPPTTGTSVFSPTTASSEPQSTPLLTGGGFPSDMVLHRPRYTLTSYGFYNTSRLTGGSPSVLETFSTAAQTSYGSTYWKYDNSTAAYIPANGYFNNNGEGSIGYALYSFRRAPGVFDVVCYTGTGVNRTVNHNLTVAPELMIVKRRDTTGNWQVYSAYLPSAAYILTLNSTSGQASSGFDTVWNSTAPTASVFTVGTSTTTNASGGTYVAYLFATVGGVSKVGSYRGTGTTQQINCGFTNGSRFVMIKRTDSTGDWYVWDSARGIVAGNDPYLLLNNTNAEVTNTDYVDTYSLGFELSSTAPAGLNANGGKYIFLAIA